MTSVEDAPKTDFTPAPFGRQAPMYSPRLCPNRPQADEFAAHDLNVRGRVAHTTHKEEEEMVAPYNSRRQMLHRLLRFKPDGVS